MTEEGKMLDYIADLEEINKQLISSLKECLELLARLQPTVDWEKKLKDLEKITGLNDNMVRKRQAGFGYVNTEKHIRKKPVTL